MLASEDYVEGPRAFAEKRKPVWTGADREPQARASTPASGPPAPPAATTLAAIQEAERLGFDSIWTSEAYGCDVLTPLAWWGSQTERVRLGTSIMQISARRPTAAAMAAMTMDHLSGGRFVLGLGVSGPQVVEGWYGEPFAKPLARTREYVSIVRDVIARRAPVTSAGRTTRCPLNGARWRHRARQAAEDDAPPAARADPDLPRRRRPEEHRPDGRDRRRLARPVLLAPPPRRAVPTVSGGGIRAAPSRPPDGLRDRRLARLHRRTTTSRRPRTMIRPRLALYFGGMGARSMNFHHEVAVRMGYGARGPEDPGAVPGGQEGRGGRRRPDQARRAALADRPAGQDPPRPRGVARSGVTLAADRRARPSGCARPPSSCSGR